MPTAKPIVWPYGHNLTDIRGSLSLENASRKIGVVRQTWAGWEEGTSVPREENLKAIVEAFGCPPDLVGYKPPKGYELVPAEWIRQQNEQLMAELRTIRTEIKKLR